MSTSIKTYGIMAAIVLAVGVAFGAGQADEASTPAAAAIDKGQAVYVAPETTPEPVATPEATAVLVEAPAPVVEPVIGDAAYVPSTNDCGPDAYRIEPGTCEQYVDTPTVCAEGLILAEDGSCVPPSFYDDASSIGPFIDLAPCSSDGPDASEQCYWDASERGDGLGTDFVQIDGVIFTPAS